MSFTPLKVHSYECSQCGFGFKNIRLRGIVHTTSLFQARGVLILVCLDVFEKNTIFLNHWICYQIPTPTYKSNMICNKYSLLILSLLLVKPERNQFLPCSSRKSLDPPTVYHLLLQLHSVRDQAATKTRALLYIIEPCKSLVLASKTTKYQQP